MYSHHASLPKLFCDFNAVIHISNHLFFCRCAGLADEDLQPGDCGSIDPCYPNPCPVSMTWVSPSVCLYPCETKPHFVNFYWHLLRIVSNSLSMRPDLFQGLSVIFKWFSSDFYQHNRIFMKSAWDFEELTRPSIFLQHYTHDLSNQLVYHPP